ncbi:hypothetical protein M9H77_26769 [Catharanthus roseus]|uniref:Uncharacterized protein n=1 Tax=Catharanthus roseus TaxID=4058 RepID=A0ACC0AEP2_CATRO|nr:hypothetical protein M9H77_26769 [Catharanthus roseus]
MTGSLMSVMSKFAGSRNKRPDVVCDVLAPTQKRKKVKPSDWKQPVAAEGGPVDPELIPSYDGHVVGRIWRGQDCGLLKCRSRYMALTGWELTDSQAGPLAEQLIRAVQQDLGLGLTGGLGFNALELHVVATSRQTSRSHQVRATCYLQYILGSSLFSDKSGNIVPVRLWPLLRDVSHVGSSSMSPTNIVPEGPSILETRGKTVVDYDRARNTTHRLNVLAMT